MKKQISKIASLLAIAVLVFSVSVVKAADTKEIKIKTTAHCNDCKVAIEKAMKSTKGVVESTVNLNDKMVTVKYDEARTNPEKIKKALSKAGYLADEKKDAQKDDKDCKDKKDCKSHPDCKDKKDAKTNSDCKDKTGCKPGCKTSTGGCGSKPDVK